MFSDHDRIREEINYRKISLESPNVWKLNNMFEVTHESKKKLQGKLKSILN